MVVVVVVVVVVEGRQCDGVVRRAEAVLRETVVTPDGLRNGYARACAAVDPLAVIRACDACGETVVPGGDSGGAVERRVRDCGPLRFTPDELTRYNARPVAACVMRSVWPPYGSGAPVTERWHLHPELVSGEGMPRPCGCALTVATACRPHRHLAPP
jgi:hypothetical protein